MRENSAAPRSDDICHLIACCAQRKSASGVIDYRCQSTHNKRNRAIRIDGELRGSRDPETHRGTTDGERLEGNSAGVVHPVDYCGSSRAYTNGFCNAAHHYLGSCIEGSASEQG